MTVQFTREYMNSDAAQADIARMARVGFTPVSITSVEQRVGLGRIALLGIFAFAFKPKTHVLVVYQGEKPEPTKRDLHYADAAASMEQARASWEKLGRNFGPFLHTHHRPKRD